ncbi:MULTISPECIES: hypoxanthine phosphoribosyltransferase [Aerococcus]|uniref:Hypoxanthine phosphoribosyltransferase n=1 Tax=Aerococcus sanguinicola TaxID=119206 RepID=A0A5N1GIR3_9LACT|nr:MULTISPECIES: hypoxanthine phosphoribosyltransferase [Aerococcus]KAA9300833.1 hypoxanthine phosphoribosyltransferase [Aerococcus sanguinicola]MDK6369378.1 hypoxanthine phosphoribosyltransferase [Aerococcus sp. UMB9870]MDK6679879.1 hypoxanthine phosphoribosyltransferase [Aerococcus sp. UMB8608]MDK6687613.1 hypoxanthine phosphoribosyltransferase [Aerococcus sp. UMB8623]MDK6939801.1 hypoxanthine phosphoribosyltransferase [Aerococcus sp. UMB8487]
MDELMEEILVSEEDLQVRIKELAGEIAKDYRDKNPLLVCVLKGGMPFMADLMKAMDILLEIDFMDVSSYGDGFESSGEVKIVKDLSQPVKDRHVIFVEDIIDTGRTLTYLYQVLESRQAASIKTVALLDKPARRTKAFEADWIGFEIPDKFVVGYGLDFKGQLRNYPQIAVLKEEVYS